jgi:hypothetical protein
MYIVEIEDGVWLAPWEGDPGRTQIKERARRYATLKGAKIALGLAIRKLPIKAEFLTAKIERV